MIAVHFCTALLLALVCSQGADASISVNVQNNCNYEIMVAATYFVESQYTSMCNSVYYFSNGDWPACLVYWYPVAAYSTFPVVWNLYDGWIYATAYMTHDPSYTWPAVGNCDPPTGPDACQHDLQYIKCSGTPSQGCYTWEKAGNDPTQVGELHRGVSATDLIYITFTITVS